MAKNYKIGMLWIEGRLGWIEEMCIKSYLSLGYEVILYRYGRVENVPDGVILEDAREVLPEDKIIKNIYNNSVAVHADRFRYKLLLSRDDIIWSDVDAYCLREYKLNNGYFLSWGTKGLVFIGVLAMPRSSVALQEVSRFTDDEYPLPPWEKSKYISFRKKIGLPVHVSKQKWTVWGPRALTYFMKKSGEDRYVMPEKALYPVSAARKDGLIDGSVLYDDLISNESVYSVHIYATWMRQKLKEMDMEKIRGSLIWRLAEMQGVEVKDDYKHHKPPHPIIRAIRKKIKI